MIMPRRMTRPKRWKFRALLEWRWTLDFTRYQREDFTLTLGPVTFKLYRL